MTVTQVERVGVPNSDPTDDDIAESISLGYDDIDPSRIVVDDWTAPVWYGHDGWVIETVWYSVKPAPGLGNIWDNPNYY